MGCCQIGEGNASLNRGVAATEKFGRLEERKKMKNDYMAHEFRVKTKEYWKNRRPTIQQWDEMMRKQDEGFVVIHHPNGVTERIPKKV